MLKYLGNCVYIEYNGSGLTPLLKMELPNVSFNEFLALKWSND